MKKLFLVLLLLAFCALTLSAQDNTIWKLDLLADPPQGVSTTKNFCWSIDTHLELFSPDSTLKVFFYLPPGDYGKYKLRVTDRASSLDMVRAGSFGAALYPDDPDEDTRLRINIDVNDKEAVYDANINWIMDEVHTYNIGRFLAPGGNTVYFEINPLSVIRYDIKKIELLSN